ncbi:methionyl-tRNA formyltransferase [Thermoleophilia bacterium SCSIO 60948]|nr:methionyl-tRNA formyltransferase [Thermoleophilia bacterium SCSIO 60948]
MRLAYLGTSDFAADVLGRLADSRHEVVLVVSQPDRRKGRGRKLAPPPVAERARKLDLELVQTASVNRDEGAAPVLAAGVDVAVVCAFGQLIAEPILGSLELLNVHPSALPRWRGAAPIERSIMAGDKTTAAAIMRLVRELDAGPVALATEVEIGPREDFGSLSARLAGLGGELLVSALDRLEAGELEFTEQEADGVTYAEKITASDRLLDPGSTAVELDRRVRALHPHIGTALALAGDERLGVLEARPWDGNAGPAAGELGAVDGALLLGTREGALELLVVRPPGKREMRAADYLRGRELPSLA